MESQFNSVPQSDSHSSVKDDLPIFIKWFNFIKWLLNTTDHFPKKVRFTFTERLNQLSMNVIEDLIEARYTRNKSIFLRRANLNLEKIRVFIRLAYEMKILPRKSYEYASFAINETGKMLGGWMKQQGEYEKAR